MYLLPAIDILGGKAVRLAKGDYDRVTVYNDDPAAQAQAFEEEGATWLHVVDLDGARSGQPENIAIIERILKKTLLKVEVGGGIRSLDTIARLADAGVSRIVLGTSLVADPAFAEAAAARYGGLLTAGIDAKGGEVAVAGWREGAGVAAEELARHVAQLGFRHLVYTDIARDGMQTGVDPARLRGAWRQAFGRSRHRVGRRGRRGRHRAAGRGGRQHRGRHRGPRRLRGRSLGGRRRARVRRGHQACGSRRRGRRSLWDGRRAMLAKRVIPCMDVKDGRVVKGVNFVNLRDAGDPIELAQRYDEERADEVIFLDITATSDGRATTVGLASRASEQLHLPYCVGGGFRNVADIRTMIAAGADKVSVNSAAVADPSLITQAAAAFGSQAILCAIDAKQVAGNPNKWEVYVHGGRKATGIDAVAWAAEAARRGAGEILLTSMDRDGSRDGFDCALTRAVARAVDVPVIASGGVGALEHFAQGILEGEADAVLAASVFHFGELTVRQVKEHMASQGIPVRL